ncbi:MAG TPA: maltose alpha-D-glucosyltransferase [Chthoniobacterales bacterium]
MTPLKPEPQWYKDAVIYQTHVKSFYDSNGDGIGDFPGLLQKLDYLDDLGVSAIWLLPFYPSPLRDDGYDIADYYAVNPSYGTLQDFKDFLDAAHRRGIRVITELVMNHTSDQNAWFQKSRRAAPGSEWRDFYVWNDSPFKYADARIIFKDFETSNWSWDPVAKSYFWHRFYSHQPDLNFDNPAVFKEMLRAIDFWLAMGVDGLRLDAIPYLVEREGTNCENLPETHEILKKLRTFLDEKYPDVMLLAEANMWPEDAVQYFGNGDECHMAFHFPVMPRMFMALQMEDRFPVIDILEQTPALPETCQWATFLRNHDELTLEMVTDEERDYMWRVYATDARARINLGIRRRLAPLMSNNRRKVELINVLLFSLPGTPVVYYGDEIGMGDNIYLGDRNGCRTPMQWSSDRNAGFSRANPQQLYLPVTIDSEYHYEAVNVENRERNVTSLLWWMRRVIAMRKRYKAFGRGTLEFLNPENSHILAFIRHYEDETILVVINLSRFSQIVELDLSRFSGQRMFELYSHNEFPPITDKPYLMTMTRHDYFVLRITPAAIGLGTQTKYEPPVIDVETVPELDRLLSEEARSLLEENLLPAYLPTCRWFASKSRTLRTVSVLDSVLFPEAPGSRMVFLNVEYYEGGAELYLVPLALAGHEKAQRLIRDWAPGVVARFHLATTGEEWVLCDAVADEEFRSALFHLIAKQTEAKCETGVVAGLRGQGMGADVDCGITPDGLVPSQLLKVEQSNSAITYCGRYFFKLYRKLDEGINPDIEITRHLTELASFTQSPPFAGTISYARPGREPISLGLLQALVPNEGDSWTATLDNIGRYYERVLLESRRGTDVPVPGLFAEAVPVGYEKVIELIGGVYPEKAKLLGIRTAEMHLGLASPTDDPAFAPEPFTSYSQRSIVQTMRATVKRTMELVKRQLKKTAPSPERDLLQQLLTLEKDILAREAQILQIKIHAIRTRIHGDYHLGQVLGTGKDVMIIDFEGEPQRPMGERRLKRSPLRDVASMIRSFHYAPHATLALHPAWHRQEDRDALLPWAEHWAQYVGRTFLDAYLQRASGAAFLPDNPEHTRVMLDAYLLDKSVYEIDYELNNRPAWLQIPLRGVLHVLRG